MTRQRWIYVGLLGLGLVALAADRLVLSPAGAAAATDAGVTGAEPTDSTPASPSIPGPVRPNLADRLSKIAWDAPGGVRDGFKADESWVLPPRPEAAPGAKEPAGFSIAEWETRNPLRSIYAVMRQGAPAGNDPDSPLAESPREFKARFGDNDVSAGEYIDGCRVLTIEATTVWIEHEGQCYAVDILHPRKADGTEPKKTPSVVVKQNAEPAAPEAPGR
jgi:hypothetical protein